MSFLRPLSLQPSSLRESAMEAWIHHVLHMIRDQQIISRGKGSHLRSPSFEDCLKVLTLNLSSPQRGRMDKLTLEDILSYSSSSACLYQHHPYYSSNEDDRSSGQSPLVPYLDEFLPLPYQEQAYHRGAKMLKRELFFDMFPAYFGLVWRPEFKHLDLPVVHAKDGRLFILEELIRHQQRLRNACNNFRAKRDDDSSAKHIETAKIKFLERAELSIEESYLLKRVLRGFTHLKVLVLWHVCDDAMLNIIGSTCKILESLDIYRSTNATDLGIKLLLTSDDSISPSPLCSTLRRLGLKETCATHIGCLAALTLCRELEVLNLSHYSVDKAFFSEVRKLNKVYPCLKTLFFPVAEAEAFEPVARTFPGLEELSLWLTTVPNLREDWFQLNLSKPDDALFPRLRSLHLGGYQSNALLLDLLSSDMGGRLTTLKIETVTSEIPLQVIGRQCPNLVEFVVINGALSIKDHVCLDSNVELEAFFPKLRLLHLFLVAYNNRVNNPEEFMDESEMVVVGNGNGSNSSNTSLSPASCIHCLLTHARNVEAVQITGVPSNFTDEALRNILSFNPLTHLRRFVLTDVKFQLERTVNDSTGLQGLGILPTLPLTAASVKHLFDSCPQLQCIGDLRNWQVTPQERRQLCRELQERSGIKWISTSNF